MFFNFQLKRNKIKWKNNEKFLFNLYIKWYEKIVMFYLMQKYTSIIFLTFLEKFI